MPVALRLRDLGWARWEICRRRVLCDEMTRHGVGVALPSMRQRDAGACAGR